MAVLNLVSWNVNGIRACEKKGFPEWLKTSGADVVCLQETKARPEQLSEELINPPGYRTFWASAEKKGYSGVCIMAREPLDLEECRVGFGKKEFDNEGRTLILRTGDLEIVNSYFPNSSRDHSRLPFKLAYNAAILRYLNKRRKAGLDVVICGDFNVAHRAIDLKNPRSNENNAGYLPEERAWMTRFLKAGYTDTFRHFNPDLADQYSWWSYRPGVRQKNIGWRLDYFCVARELEPRLKSAAIHPGVMGSDHCPVSVTIAT